MTDISRTPLVLFHGGCFDGFTAAWAFRKFKGPNAEFVPMSYGQEDIPNTKGRMVWMLDYSLPRKVMIDQIIIPSIKTVVYDHHKTAEVELKGVLEEIYQKRGLQRQADKIVFDMSRSGAGITYDELEREAGIKAGRHVPRFNGQRPDRFVDYIEDRDTWKWQLPNSKEVSAYIAMLPHTFEAWDELAKTPIGEIVEKGKAVQQYIDNFGSKACEMARIRNIGGYDVPVINVPYMNCSDHVGMLAGMYPDHPFAAGFFLNGFGQWQFSLRSRAGEDGEQFDVSEVAKMYGGGGHRGAGGFQADTLPWEE